MKFNKLLGAALLASSMLVAGAANAKTLVYCSEGSPENFTPAINTTGTSFDAARPVYNQLVQFKRGTTKVEPGLAEKLDRVATTALTITFKLRKGVKFHSGVNGFTPTRDFNADDVIWSFDRQWKPDHPYAKVSGGTYDYFNDMDMPNLLEVDRARVRRLDGRDQAEEAERPDPRQPGHGLRHHPLGRICRVPAEEGHARAVRPDPGRHRPVLRSSTTRRTR